jgi:hypothetical protein
LILEVVMKLKLIFEIFGLVCTLFIKLYEVRLVNKSFPESSGDLKCLYVQKNYKCRFISGKNIQGVRNHLSQEVY